MSAETDVAVAWIKTWNASTGLQRAVPGGLVSDLAPESRPLASSTERTTPYAELTVEPGPEKLYDSSGDYIDVEKVTLTVWGTGKQALGNVLSAVHALYDSKPNQPSALDFSGAPAVKAHMRTLPVSDQQTEDATRKQGEAYRKAVAVFEVQCHRSEG